MKSLLILAVEVAVAVALDPAQWPLPDELAPFQPQWATEYDLSPANIAAQPANMERAGCLRRMEWAQTFDDSPSPNTIPVLDALDTIGLRSTFFVTGSRVLQNPDALLTAFQRGMHIGCRTWSQPDLTTLTPEQIVAELRTCMDIVSEVIGKTPLYWRPPSGNMNDLVRRISSIMGIIPVTWNADTLDDLATTQRLADTFEIGESGVISIQRESVPGQAVPIAREVLENGYMMVTVADCLNGVAYRDGLSKTGTAGVASGDGAAPGSGSSSATGPTSTTDSGTTPTSTTATTDPTTTSTGSSETPTSSSEVAATSTTSSSDSTPTSTSTDSETATGAGTPESTSSSGTSDAGPTATETSSGSNAAPTSASTVTVTVTLTDASTSVDPASATSTSDSQASSTASDTSGSSATATGAGTSTPTLSSSSASDSTPTSSSSSAPGSASTGSTGSLGSSGSSNSVVTVTVTVPGPTPTAGFRAVTVELNQSSALKAPTISAGAVIICLISFLVL